MNQPTLLEILNKTSDFFKSKGIENYRLDAQLILGHVLNLSRMDLYLNFDRPLTQEEISISREAVKRRSSREPLQHILGKTPFRNIELKVDKRCLVPRRETELIVDHVIESSKKIPKDVIRVIDVGTGTGAIGLSVALELEKANVVMSDVSKDALALATENLKSQELKNIPEILESNLLSEFLQKEPFDIVVSNPPYIPKSDINKLEPEVKNWDPEIALVGGEKGWEIPEKLISQAYECLCSPGFFIMEMGYNQGPHFRQFCEDQGWKKVQILQDYSQLDRFLLLER